MDSVKNQCFSNAFGRLGGAVSQAAADFCSACFSDNLLSRHALTKILSVEIYIKNDQDLKCVL